MIFSSIDYSGGGANRIDIDEIETKAKTLFDISPHITSEQMDFYESMIVDLRNTVFRILGKKICGVSALFCFGSDDAVLTDVEKVDNYGASFVGGYCDIKIVDTATNQNYVNTEMPSAQLPVAVFTPVDAESLPGWARDEYSGIASDLYPYISIPLVGMPVVIERLPFHAH